MKKDKEFEVEKAEETKVNQPENAPLAPEVSSSADREVLSHQWQPNSPAINTNSLAGYAQSVDDNVVQKLMQSPEQKKAQEDAEKLKYVAENDPDDYKWRTKLDVSDPKYLNPSLDHGKK